MAINYANLQGVAKRLIGDNGRVFKALRTFPMERINGVETRPAALAFDVIGITVEYSPYELSNTLIKSGDVRLIATSDEQLKIGDVIDVDGTNYRVEKPNPIKPGPVVLVYKAQLRPI